MRDRELATFWKYSLAQSLSGAVYTGVPILVGISTFVIYVAMVLNDSYWVFRLHNKFVMLLLVVAVGSLTSCIDRTDFLSIV